MNLDQLKPRLRVAALAMGVGLAVLFGGRFLSWVTHFDVACVKASSTSEKIVFDVDASSKIISSRQLSLQPEKSRGFQLITVTDDPEHIFESSPPSPLDYAVILKSLHNLGYDSVILSTRMTWDDEPGLEAKGLGTTLNLFQRAVIALPVTRGATAQTPPEPLQRALIPFSKIKGDHKLIPTVNQVTLPAHAGGGDQTLAGFHRIESTPSSPSHIPMLAHWEGQGLIPSVELLAIMSLHDVSPADLTIHCGRHIRFGRDGPVIPIDIYGQSSAPSRGLHALSRKSAAPLIAEKLITPQNDQNTTSQPNKPTQVCLIHAEGKKTSATNTLDGDRLAKLVTLSGTFYIPGKPTHYRRLPRWAEIIIILDLALAACWLAGFKPGNRHLAFALVAVSIFPLMLAMMDLTHHWFGLSAPLATVITAWLMPLHIRKKTTTRQEYHTSDPKPVMRA